MKTSKLLKPLMLVNFSSQPHSANSAWLNADVHITREDGGTASQRQRALRACSIADRQGRRPPRPIQHRHLADTRVANDSVGGSCPRRRW